MNIVNSCLRVNFFQGKTGLNTNGASALTFGAGAFLRGVPAPQNAILRSTVAQAPAIKTHLHQIAKHLRQINPHLRQIARHLRQTNLQNLTPPRGSNLVRTIRREPRSNAERASRVCPFRHGHGREPYTCRLLQAKPFRCKVGDSDTPSETHHSRDKFLRRKRVRR